MAVTLRARRTAYDNIGVGSATGAERVIDGSAGPAEKVGGLDNIAVGSAHPTTVISDNIKLAVAAYLGEKVGNQ